jgi:hypothetical protein
VLVGASSATIEQIGRLMDLSDPPPFVSFAMTEWKLWKENRSAQGWNLLVDGQIMQRAVSNPAALEFPDALELTSRALETDPLFDTKLLRSLLAQRLWPEEVPPDEALRVLELLEALNRQRRLAMTLLKFAKYPDARIQSKIAKMLGRCIDKIDSLQELAQHPDARVRANLIEGLAHRNDLKGFTALVETASHDPHPRVSSLALALRARLGCDRSSALLRVRKKSKLESFQKAAVRAEEVMNAPSTAETQPAMFAPVHEVDQKPESHPNEQPEPVGHTEPVHQVEVDKNT